MVLKASSDHVYALYVENFDQMAAALTWLYVAQVRQQASFATIRSCLIIQIIHNCMAGHPTRNRATCQFLANFWHYLLTKGL
jgi:hypothetical protein